MFVNRFSLGLFVDIKSPFLSPVHCSLSNQTGQRVFIWVGGRISVPFIISTGTMAALLFPAWPTLSQPPDSSRLALSPLSPLALLFSPLQLSSPALPGAPLRILLRSRPLSPKAGPNPPHRSPWEFPPQHSRPRSSALTLLNPEQPALLK